MQVENEVKIITAVWIISDQSHLPVYVMGPLSLEVLPLRFGGLVSARGVFARPGVMVFSAGLDRRNSVYSVK